MSTIQDRYEDFVEKSQTALHNAVDSWVEAMRGTLASAPPLAADIDPQGVVNQGFEVAEQILAMQREYATALVEKSIALGESVKAAYSSNAASETTE